MALEMEPNNTEYEPCHSFLSGNMRFSSLLVRSILENNNPNKNFIFDCIGVVSQLSGLHAAADESVQLKIEHLFGIDTKDKLNKYENQETVSPDYDGVSYQEVGRILKSVCFKHKKTILGKRKEKSTSSAFIDCSYYPTNSFIEDLKGFGITTRVVDFQSENPLKAIKKKLVDILKRKKEYYSLSNPLSKLILINEGTIAKNWTRSFKKKQVLPFYGGQKVGPYLATYLTVTAPFRVGHITELNAHMVQLPYSGQHQNMYIILPDQCDGLKELEKNLCRLDAWCLWNTFVQQLTAKLTFLAVPEFEYTTFIDMKPLLEQLGIRELFDSKSHIFSAVSGEEDFCISEYYQLNHATIVETGQLVPPSEQQKELMLAVEPSGVIAHFEANHPFLFLIQDENTKTILFFGRVSRPIKANRFATISQSKRD